MGGIFKAIFSGPPEPPPPPPVPDRSAIEANAKAEQEKLKAQQAEEEAAIRRGRRGIRSLIAPEGSELGFPSLLGG